MADLAIVNGRVLDPASGMDGPLDVEVDEGRITRLGSAGAAEETIDASGLLLVPGLVDLHTHLYEGVSHYGIDTDRYCLERGVTTAVDAGSAGAQTFPGFRRLIDRAETRVLAFLHVAVQGLISGLVGELEDPRWASPTETAARAREHSDVVVGVSVRLGAHMSGPDPAPALLAARRAADDLGLPLRVHAIDMERPVGWLLEHLREGDIVGNCFHPYRGGILDDDGHLHRDVELARSRGVLFDLGHGGGSFSYRVARAAFAQGFFPDTVSSDLHAQNVDGPVYDQATTLSKLLHLGMSMDEVVRSTTSTPARAIRRLDTVGSLQPGRECDLTGLEMRPGRWRLTDGEGAEEIADILLVPRLVVRAGLARWLEPPTPRLLAVGA